MYKEDVVYKGILLGQKKNEILPSATMDEPRPIMLSEISQIKKDKYSDFTYMGCLQKKTKQTRSDL